MKVIVFDLGGTLMEYTGMPFCWTDYYKQAFENINRELSLNLSDDDIKRSIEIFTSFNPRVVYREIEYSPGYIFESVMKHWKNRPDIGKAIESFFKGIKLEPKIYPDTVPCLMELRQQGYLISTLTDLPTAMPDSLFKADISNLLEYFDLYASSLTCGFRKPNPSGLLYIADYFSTDINNLIFVGDEEKDAKTAEKAGCRFICINRNKRTDMRYTTISSLSELKPKLPI